MIFELDFDNKGGAVFPQQLDNLIAESKGAGVTDAIFFVHGFRCTASDAAALYTNLLDTLLPNLAGATADRTFAFAGVYWPSEEFSEHCSGDIPPHRFIESVLAKYGDGSDDPAEGLPLLHQFTGAEILAQNTIDKFLNFMSWMVLKKL